VDAIGLPWGNVPTQKDFATEKLSAQKILWDAAMLEIEVSKETVHRHREVGDNWFMNLKPDLKIRLLFS